MTSLLHTLLELGHITSQNLGFAQTTHGGITFSEETITETNLLEFRRRHPQQVHVHSFSKATESKTTGADWEWHIIGRARTLKMRVQAKRIYKKGGIGNLLQQGQTAPAPQINLLLSDAKRNGLLPIYCFYCSETQRSHWTIRKSNNGEPTLETGCLIVDARTVKQTFPRKLGQIETHCVPWHYLCYQSQFLQVKEFTAIQKHYSMGTKQYYEGFKSDQTEIPFESIFPTTYELASGDAKPDTQRGVYATDKDALSVQKSERYRERGISRLIQIDLRDMEFHPDDIEFREISPND